jgi:hypothetical protein
MFGMRASTSSYGRDFATNNVPNLVPSSNSMNVPSVHNTSSDLVTNDISSTFVIPSLHPDLIKNNEFSEGDFVFALNPRYADLGYTTNYNLDYKSAFNGTIMIVTLPKLNELLYNYALAHSNKTTGASTSAVPWFTETHRVLEWARPFGVVLNKMRLTGGRHGRGNASHYGINVCTSRRANVKNNFLAMVHSEERDWFGQSTMPIAVQYSVEEIRSTEDALLNGTNIVMVSMILEDECVQPRFMRTASLQIQSTGRQSNETIDHFSKNPVKENSSLITVGRVLNSCMRSPTPFMALHSCYNKSDYDSLPPLEVELGSA